MALIPILHQPVTLAIMIVQSKSLPLSKTDVNLCDPLTVDMTLGRVYALGSYGYLACLEASPRNINSRIHSSHQVHVALMHLP